MPLSLFWGMLGWDSRASYNLILTPRPFLDLFLKLKGEGTFNQGTKGFSHYRG